MGSKLRYSMRPGKAGTSACNKSNPSSQVTLVWVDENWRLTFKFEGKNAVLVEAHVRAAERATEMRAANEGRAE
jgi:hypothetical protein